MVPGDYATVLFVGTFCCCRCCFCIALALDSPATTLGNRRERLLQCKNDNTFISEDGTGDIHALFLRPLHNLTHRVCSGSAGQLDRVPLFASRLGELNCIGIIFLAGLDGKLFTLIVNEHLDKSRISQIDMGSAVELDLIAANKGRNSIGASGDQLDELKLFKYGHSNYSPLISMISIFSEVHASCVVVFEVVKMDSMSSSSHPKSMRAKPAKQPLTMILGRLRRRFLQ